MKSLTELIKTFSLTLGLASVYSVLVCLTSPQVVLNHLFLITAQYPLIPFDVVALNPFVALLFLLASMLFYKMSDVAFDAKI